MFAAFFYLLRQRGLHVSLNEWMTLLEGMEKGLHHSTLTGFYHLCRAIVVKNETEFDRFDQIFLEFFKNVPYTGELPEDLLDWLNHPSEDLKRTIADLRSAGFPNETPVSYTHLRAHETKAATTGLGPRAVPLGATAAGTPTASGSAGSPCTALP